MRIVCHNICSYLVQSTREVRKLEYCVWARLVKRTDGKCLCTSPSDLWLCNNWVNATLDLWSGRADSFPLVSHICASELGLRNWISICSCNGWLPVRRQAIAPSHPDLLSIAHLGINFSAIRIKNFSFMKTYLNIYSDCAYPSSKSLKTDANSCTKRRECMPFKITWAQISSRDTRFIFSLHVGAMVWPLLPHRDTCRRCLCASANHTLNTWYSLGSMI